MDDKKVPDDSTKPSLASRPELQARKQAAEEVKAILSAYDDTINRILTGTGT